MTAFPGHGHLQPMLPLARAARAAGHDVVIATGPDLAPDVERRGFTALAVGSTMAEAFASGAGRQAPDSDDRFVIAGTVVFVPAAERLATDLLPWAERWAPDVVVSETLELGGLIVADRVGARFVAHGLGPLPEPAHWQDVAAFERLCGTWGLAEPFGRLFDATYLDICPPALHLREHTPTQHVVPMRPAVGDTGPTPELDAMLARLPYDRTVHLTLGTIVNKADGAFDTALAGLRDLPANLVVTVGADVDPATLGPQPEHVVVERYLPHAALLPHCTAVVSHAGAATLLAASAHGLPQLLLPRAGDQFANTDAAVAAGAALGVMPDDADAEAITTAAMRLLSDSSFTRSAQCIQAEIRAMPPAEEVLAGLLGVSA